MRNGDGSDSSGSLRSPPSSDNTDAKSPGSGQQSGDQSSGNQSGGKQSSALDDNERAQAIAEIRYYAAAHREAIDAMLEGVLLGAEQVQNVRLNMLESGAPPEGIQTVVLSLVLTFVLEGTIGPAIAAAVAQRILRPIFLGLSGAVRLRAKAGRLESELRLLRDNVQQTRAGLSKLRGIRKQTIKEQAEAMNRVANAMESDVARNRQDAKKIVVTWRGISDDLAENLVSGAKVVREWSTRPDSRAGQPDASTTPGVSAMATAMEQAAAMRLGIVAATEGYIWVIQQATSTVDDVKQILTDFRPMTLDLAGVRDAFSMISEAVIWAKTLNITAPNSDGKPVLDKSVDGFAVSDERLRSYLRVRFAKAAQDWASGAGIVDKRTTPSASDPVSAGTPSPLQSLPMNSPAIPMEGGGFSGPQDVLTPQQKLLNDLGSNLDILVQLYLGTIGQDELTLSSELAEL
jgi:hypothetical protein